MLSISSAILVVDDDQEICEFVSEGLVGDGYTCEVASTANEALAKLQNYRFDIALFDIRLPGKSGIELLRTVRALFQNIKIVMITAVEDLDTAVQAMKLGASDYVVKPFTIDRLGTVIREVLENGERHNSVYDTISLTGTTGNCAEIDSRSLRAINAIAYGVDAQVDYFDFHSQIVTEKTIGVARQFGIPPKEVEKWAITRNELYSERKNLIMSSINKLERNPIAQMILGLTRPVNRYLNSNGKEDSGDFRHGTYDS
jgi:CheY-like chemotaxis protein